MTTTQLQFRYCEDKNGLGNDKHFNLFSRYRKPTIATPAPRDAVN